MDREYFYCPLDDGEDFPGSTNCGGNDFGSRLALDIHYSTAHLGAGGPVWLGVAPGNRPSAPEDYAAALRELRPFVGSMDPDLHGAPVIPRSHGWGMLGAAAGIGQGLPQSQYVVWSQGTPIAWYLDDRTGTGWVAPEGDYYKYDRITSRHQGKIFAAVRLLTDTDPATHAAAERWAAKHRAAWGVET